MMRRSDLLAEIFLQLRSLLSPTTLIDFKSADLRPVTAVIRAFDSGVAKAAVPAGGKRLKSSVAAATTAKSAELLALMLIIFEHHSHFAAMTT